MVFRSIYTRLLVLYLVILLAATGFLSLAVYERIRSDKIDARLNELMIQAQDLAYLASQRSAFGSQQTDRYLKRKCDDIDREFGAYIVILDRLGNLIQASEGEEEVPVETTLEYLSGVLESGTAMRTRTESNGKVIFTLGVPWVENDRVYGAVFVHTNAQSIVASYESVVMDILRAMLAALAAGALMVLAASRYLTRPLKQMATAAERFARGDFTERVRVRAGRRDEIATLANAFNGMADDLERLEITRREFVANVSHELRSPLTSMQGFINGILDGTVPPDQREHYLGIVLDETRRLNKLITTLLDLSSIESGKAALSRRAFDVNEMILRVVARQEAELTRLNADVDIRFEHESCMVNADPDRIEQVVINLIANAIKYLGEKDGKLTLATSAAEGKVTVSVSDNGPGIAPEDLPHVFERFYMGDKAHTSGKGTGLGLAICKSIVEQHGQRIEALSTPGQGACFRFTLDAAEENGKAQRLPPPDGKES